MTLLPGGTALAAQRWLERYFFVRNYGMFGQPTKWTTKDDEKIRTLIAQGASVTRVVAAVKRRRTAVLKRARDLGCPFPPSAFGRKKSA
jgi:hypothetical protein